MNVASIAPAGQPPPMPPSRSPHGVLRVWGLPELAHVARAAATSELFPDDVSVELTMTGSDIAMAALYTANADVALLGREATDAETKAFEWVYRYRPLACPVLRGSVASPGRSPALAVLVNADNPVQQVTTAELAAIFRADADAPPNSGTWGALGLDAAWSDAPVALYGPLATSGTGRYFRQQVLAGSTKMAWSRLTEFAEPVGEVDTARSAHIAVARAVAADRLGLGIGAIPPAGLAVRAVPLAVAAGQPALLPTIDSVSTGRYPLSRTVFAYVNAQRRQALSPKVDAFLRALTDNAVHSLHSERDNGYLPITE